MNGILEHFPIPFGIIATLERDVGDIKALHLEPARNPVIELGGVGDQQ